MSSNFKENLRKTIKESKETKEKIQEEMNQFAHSWHQLKDGGWVARTLRTAVAVLKEENVYAGIRSLNSSSDGIALEIYENPNDRPQHRFALASDRAKMEITLSSPANHQDEIFDLRGLNESTLEARLTDFVRVVLGPEQSTQ